MMVAEVYVFDVTIPAGTLRTAPQTTALAIPARVIREVDVIVPPGCNGRVGFRIAVNGQQQIPINAGAWIIASDEKLAWPYETPISSGAWQLIGFNEGVFAHTLEVRLLVDLPAEWTRAPARMPVEVRA